MRSLQKAIAVLLVLLATGSAVSLATGPALAPATEPALAPVAELALDEYDISYSFSSDLWWPQPLSDDETLHQPFYVFIDPPLQEAEWVKWFLDGTLVATVTDPPFSTLIDPGHLSGFGIVEAQFPEELHISPVSADFEYEELTGYEITYGYSKQPSQEPLDGAVVFELFDDFHVALVEPSHPQKNILGVEFYLDGKFVGLDKESPYTHFFKTASFPVGPHRLYARVDLYDRIFGLSFLQVDADFTYVKESEKNEITYSYSGDPSAAKPLKDALVHSPFSVHFDPSLPPDTEEATFWIDDVFSPPIGYRDEAPWSIRYDPSSLSHGQHRLIVHYTNTSTSQGYILDTYFRYEKEEYDIRYSFSSDLWSPFDVPPELKYASSLHQPFYVFFDPPPQEAEWVKWFLDGTLVATVTDPPFSTFIDPGHLAEGGTVEAQFPDELHYSPVSAEFEYEELTGYKFTYSYSADPSDEPLDGAVVFDDFHVVLVEPSQPQKYILGVDWWLDGKSLGLEKKSPYTRFFNIASLPPGPHHLSAYVWLEGVSSLQVDADFTYTKITYGYSPDHSTTPLKGDLVNGPFYVFFDPGLPADTEEATFWIDDVDSPPVGYRDEAPWSIRYDPSSLMHERHILYVRYTTTSSPHEHMVSTFFWYGYRLVGGKFAVYADAHTCLPGSPYGERCNGDHIQVWKDGERKRWWRGTWRKKRLEAVGDAIKKTKAEFVVALGDAIEDLYIPLGNPEDIHMSIVADSFPAVPHYFVLGNHDIRSYGWQKVYHHGLFIDYAKHVFEYFSGHLGDNGHFVAERGHHLTTPHEEREEAWHILMLHSGETTKTFDDGSCVRFSPEQRIWLRGYLNDINVTSKSAVLLWHISPQDEVYKPEKKTKCKVDTSYVELLRTYAPKIRAIITGHTHVAKSYIWDTTGTATDPYGTIHGGYRPDWNPIEPAQIMMITAPSTGFGSGGDPDYQDPTKDYFLEVSLHDDGTLSIDNKGSIPWQALGLSEPPSGVIESRYTQADACFEQDNDGDGWFDDDKIDCPTGTHIGTELDYDSVQETYTIEAELDDYGWVSDYIPGRYHAVSSADSGETALETLSVGQHYGKCTNQTPPTSTLAPKPDGGAVAVVVAGLDGVARQIANAETRDYTDQRSGISVVSVDHTDSYTEAHLKNVPKDYQVSLYLEFEPGLKGELFIEGSSCGVEPHVWLGYEDPEFAETLALEVVDNNPEWQVQGYLPLVFHPSR